MLTRGVAERGSAFVILAVQAVRQFDAFTQGDDPYGEHDFGSFDLAGERLFWKIDLHEELPVKRLNDNSSEPVFTRVLTIMLASEY